jgi:hypothetical protein
MRVLFLAFQLPLQCMSFRPQAAHNNSGSNSCSLKAAMLRSIAKRFHQVPERQPRKARMTTATHRTTKRGTRMNRALLLGSLSIVLMFCPAALSAASITYNIQPYPAYQNGYTLSGTITTDGATGSLSGTDITAWALKVSGPSVNFSSSGSGAGTGVFLEGLTASSTQLTLPPPVQPGPETMTILELSDSAGEVIWQETIIGNSYEASNLTSIAWLTAPPDNGLGGSPWIIATASVPEPGSLTMASLASACLAAAVWTTRRRRIRSRSLAAQPAHS